MEVDEEEDVVELRVELGGRRPPVKAVIVTIGLLDNVVSKRAVAVVETRDVVDWKWRAN